MSIRLTGLILQNAKHGAETETAVEGQSNSISGPIPCQSCLEFLDRPLAVVS